jgi:hypothetical protein
VLGTVPPNQWVRDVDIPKYLYKDHLPCGVQAAALSGNK